MLLSAKARKANLRIRVLMLKNNTGILKDRKIAFSVSVFSLIVNKNASERLHPQSRLRFR